MNSVMRRILLERSMDSRSRRMSGRMSGRYGRYDRAGREDDPYYQRRNPYRDNRGGYYGEDGSYHIYGHNGLGGAPNPQDSVYRDYYDPDGNYRREDGDDDYYGAQDGRRGVKGTGRYGIGGSRYYGRRDRGMPFSVEGEIEPGDYYDGAEHEGQFDMMRLSKKDMQRWKKEMRNADGSKGEHFSLQQIMPVAEKLGIKFKDYDENELCLAVNMLYSDYCEALKSVVPQDKEVIVYTKLGRAFLEDEDAPEGAEKLAIYYYCIVNDDE